ncbi:plexin-B2a isoform X1 [Ictalurus punctatus]|uniref:Plexin-B2a isoform X1 n=1 Tax=Ictalurus punctatus TaxID=7998 RepID=A0A2D0T4V9_ICTPU|nr:plexin-B2a isoform X1 [Ictalurus punctatus]XP_053544415.1 plexin-B2a isoform X1 [Ictalurus punctatus]XP_053544416.1 plexin-B2a isoform X1 [Ictalurus punctatus]XP_053544417.1 plexin-B2a isoform X1 [Ictalurus punctatus]
MAWWRVAALLMLLCVAHFDCDQPHTHFSSLTTINNVVQDPRTGRIYLGAIDAVYQLDSNLQKESTAQTGPKKDSPNCTPPITAQCAEAVETHNVNKLLLVNSANGTLVVCGSIFRGICSLLNLSNVEQHVYYSDTKGEKTYVATPDRSVSVVGVISTFTKVKNADPEKKLSVFLVAQGYGSSDSVKLVSTRLLQMNDDMDIFENIVETSTVQAGPYMQRYQHDFRFAFKHEGYVYFLFSRAKDTSDNRKLSFVARLCDDDQNYYSYIELQLNCSTGGDNVYNKVQAAYLTSPGPILAQNLSSSGSLPEDDKVLFAVFSKADSLDSALCMYPLSSINRRLKEAIESCYRGENIGTKPIAVTSPYSTKNDQLCSVRGNIYNTYPCGAEFLPSPLATTDEYALRSSPIYARKSLLTSVAVSVVNNNTVAFVGTNMGEVLKIHLTGHADVYGKFPGDGTDSPVNKSMFFDSSRDHLYITTLKKITKVPVQACEQKKDCHSCVSQRDPYCGWCVLEGRCTRKKECSRGEEKDAWLWSPNQKCVAIQSFEPPSLSCKKTNQVKLNLSPLPSIVNDVLKCVFGSFESQAEMNNRQVICALPNVVDIPPTPETQDFVAVPVKIMVNGDIEVTHGEYKFYNCAAVVKNAVNTPCIACVMSQWGCQWNTLAHTCNDQDDSVESNIIKQNERDRCPQFENLEPKLIPVGFKTPIMFEGKNLDKYKGKMFQIGTELMKQVGDVTLSDSKFLFGGYEFAYNKKPEVNVSFFVKDKETEKRIDSTLQVVLYNCSVGREDCSLCKNADTKYKCVWCDTTHSCIYSSLCTKELEQCPAPTITDITPHFGPMEGQISVTIKGSNLGIKKEDIKRITVANVLCVHQADRYTVSTSVVCKIGPLPDPPMDLPDERLSGPVRVEVEGKEVSESTVLFTYRNPMPQEVHPTKGPQDGGTIITISGEDLYTASKDDISVTVGEVPCEVLDFGPQITCKTGPYKNLQVPSGPLRVTVKYGESTSVVVSDSTFTYAKNPKITSYSPQASFICGGRKISVVGTGFDLVQRAVMRVLPSADEFNLHPSNAEFVRKVISKNETVLEFLSPAVNVSLEDQSLRTVLELDNIQENLTEFEYHSNPVFEKMVDKSISAGSIIIVHGQGLSKAMTAQEAQAFVGDKQCVVTVLHDDKLFLEAPSTPPKARSRRQRRDTSSETLDLVIMFGQAEFNVGTVRYEKKSEVPLYIIIPAVILPMLLFIAVSVYCYRRKSQQAEREYEKVKHQLDSLEESVRDRCKKEFTDLMIEMEDHTSDLSEARIPFLDYKNYTNRVFFLPSKDGANDVMITGKLDIPETRRATVDQALNQFSNLLNSKTFLINFIRTLESRQEFNARNKVYFASLLTVALHGKLEYYTDIMRTLLLELMEEHVHSKNPKLMLRRSETVVERMLCNWMSICLYQFLKDSAGEPLYKLFKAIKHQVDKGPVDARLKRAKYTLNDTGLLGDDVEYCFLTLQVLVHGEGPDVSPVKVLNCDTISQVKEKIIEQVYRNLPYSQRPTVESVALEWRPGSTGQILSDMDLTSQKEGRWKRLNTLAHYNVRDNATLVLSRVLHTQQSFDQNQESHEERSALLEDDKVFHLVRPAEELDEVKSKRGSMKDKAPIKTITEIYLTRLLSMKGTLQQFVDDFFRSVLCSGATVPPAVKYFFDFLDEQAHKHDNVDEETIHIWKTNSLPLRFWVNILKNPHFIFDVHVTEVVDASLSVIAQTFMDACTKTEHKLTPESPSNKLLYAKEIPTYKKMVEDYYKGIRQMVPVSDQDMNTHLAEISRSHTDKLNTQVALHQLYQYASKYYDGIISSLEDDPAAQSKQLTLRLQQIAAALENKVTDL